ncbi:MAG: hypothetical protein MJ245_07420, partial [Clostridia bacterium]|nr:hypothetical protein [Clostridia bacterium]
MNINALLEMTQTVNLNSDIANKFVSSKTNNTEFTGMFDNVMNKYNVNNDTNSNVIEIDDTKIDKTETKVKTDEIKSDDSLNEIDDNDSYEKVDFDDEDKEAFHKEATKALSALLNMFNEKPELIEKYFNVNEDGSYELNVDAINDLQIDFSKYLLDDNIQIDMNILNNDESFNFESLLDTTLNFVKVEANDEVNFINVFTKDNSNEEIISSDLSNEVITDDVTFDENYINKNENIDIKDNIDVSDKQVVDDITNTNADTKDDFEILKNTINQMIDEVTVEDSNEEVEAINEVNVKEDIKISDEKITADIEVVNEEVGEEITNEVKDETVN